LVLKGDNLEGVKNYEVALKLTEESEEKKRIQNITLKLNN
jgi:hypothetical protein